jgi:hypothetical protein
MPWNINEPVTLVVATTDFTAGVEETTSWDPSTHEFSGDRAKQARKAALAGGEVTLLRGWTHDAGSGDELAALAAIVADVPGPFQLIDGSDALVIRVLGGAAAAEVLERSDLLWEDTSDVA